MPPMWFTNPALIETETRKFFFGIHTPGFGSFAATARDPRGYLDSRFDRYLRPGSQIGLFLVSVILIVHSDRHDHRRAQSFSDQVNHARGKMANGCPAESGMYARAIRAMSRVMFNDYEAFEKCMKERGSEKEG
ncbi:predicted protein [Botrytis cinerea T4]|uniref:Uncharacterized protein n=1 Tax=Botryotinia fuckeliana (strain T4) TaxID=999810 RepID=G2Y965_BOTF4|nr:predicted protein [Botrytis cinerea T4]